MKNKIIAICLVGFLGLYIAPTLLAKSQGQDHRTYLEFKQISAKNVQIAKKVTVKDTFEGVKAKPEKTGKPDKTEKTDGAVTGILGTEVTGNKYAIVIGIANYPGTDYDLLYTDDDAEEMREALETIYGFDSENIYTFIDKNGGDTTNATKEAIFLAVVDLKKKLTAYDEVVFFFSGHGGTGNAEDDDDEILDESIWVHDETNIVPIWDGELKEWFTGFPTDRIIFAFDSCRAGGMNDVAAEGRIVNMATTETGTAYEFSSLENGQFSHYFVDEGLLQGLADTNLEDEIVTIEEAFDYTKANYRPQDRKQSATISDNFENDLAL